MKADSEHKFLKVVNDKLVVIEGKDLVPGDVILRRIGSSVDVNKDYMTEDFADLLGFMHGDGCMVGTTTSGVLRWKIYLKDGELEHYEPIFRKYVS